MRRKRLSIKWNVFFYLISYSALLLLILWFFQTIFLDSFYQYIKIREIKSNTSEIIEHIDDISTLPTILDILSERSDCYIEIMTNSGKEILFSGDYKSKMAVLEKRNLLSHIKNGEFIQYIENEPREQYNEKKIMLNNRPPLQSIVYLKKVDDDKIILINSMISPINATITTLLYQLYYITGIMFVLSVLLAIIISKRISKPIENLNTNAKVLAKGNYDITFSSNEYKEVGELSDTLNVAATELKQVEMLRRELMANISHDLRTPLSLIYGYAEIMHDFPNEIKPEQTQTIMNETRRLTSLVNDVLDISKLESGIEKLNISMFNFTQSIKTTTDRIYELIKPEGYSLTFNYDKEVTLKADEIKITQVFYNLLVNAINYTGGDKTIVIRQIISNKNVKIEIIDTGNGISEENIPLIWDRYYKVDKNHKRAITGTGLGLSIVKNVIELHDGTYGVNSKIGKGSTFWFSLKI
jgi:signal transduction histidine kinase